MSQHPEAETSFPHVRGTVGKMVLSYVRFALGDEGVERVLSLAGGDQPQTDWASHDALVALARAAGQVCGDVSIGRRAGEEHMRQLRGAADYLRSTGSVGAALALVVDATTKMSDGRVCELVEADEESATIAGWYVPPGKPDPFFCDYAAGSYAFVPQLFGCQGVVTEPECMTRGDDRCLYRIRWRKDGEATNDGGSAVEASRQRFEELIERFERLHALASELAQAKDVDTVLERITEHAATAVRARRHLLAVRTGPGARLRVHYRNFEEATAQAFAERLIEDRLDDEAVYVTAEIVSDTRAYGRFVAVYPPGSQVLGPERRLLSAYAGHAAAALEAVATLETSQADRDTAQALLDLAQTLAEVGTKEEIARRIAAAVPAVAASDRTDVWLWEQRREGLLLVASHLPGDDGEEPADEPETFVSAAKHPELVDELRRERPFILELAEAAPVVRKLMEIGGLERIAVIPIRSGGTFLGAITAGYATHTPSETASERDAMLLNRLSGIADHAAIALHNAELLDQVRAQALHDPLTGLPNRTLLEDRARQAIARSARVAEPVSLLFIDLDRFKPVNDALGHDAGDDLLRQTAQRLRACLRTSDTAARMGGDEFVILLPNTPTHAAATVAGKVLDTLAGAYQLGAASATISASIGVATFPDHGDDFTDLIRYADAAMYEAKAAGRNRYRMVS